MFETKIKWIKFAESFEELKSLQQSRTIRPVLINNKKLLLIFHQEKFFLTKSICPHQKASLMSASCEDGFLVCPWHHYGFDLNTGRGAGLYLDIYPIEQRSEGIFAGFEYFSLF